MSISIKTFNVTRSQKRHNQLQLLSITKNRLQLVMPSENPLSSVEWFSIETNGPAQRLSHALQRHFHY